MKAFSGIGARLVVLVLVVAVPLLLALGYVVRTQADGDEQDARLASEAVAQLVAGRLDEIVSEARTTLSGLARRPLVRAVDGGRCDPLLREYSALDSRAANLGVISLEGLVVCSAVPTPGGTPVDVSQGAWFRRALATRAFAVGEPSVGQIVGRWVSVLAEPVRSPDGELRGFLAMPLDLVELSVALERVDLPRGQVVSVVTANGTVVARSVGARTWIGRDVSDADVIESLSRRGATESKGLDGHEMIFGFAGVPSTGWIVVSGVPADVAYAASRSAAWRALLAALVAVVAAFALSVLIARSIRSPLAGLTNVTVAMSRGDRGARAVETGPREVTQLAAAFNEMVEARDAAEHDAKRAAAEGERRFRALADAGSVMMWVANADPRESVNDFYSRSWLEFRGRSLEEEVGYGWRDGLHPEDRDRVTAFADESFTTPREYSIEYRMRSASGEYRTIVEHGIPVFSADGELECYVGTDLDITDRLQAERDRSEVESLLAAVLAAAPVGIGLVDDELRYIRVNDALAAFHELPADEHVGKTVAEVIGPHGFDLDHHYRHVLDTGEAVLDVEIGGEEPGSQTLFASYHPIRVDSDVIGVGIVTVDLTDRLTLEAQLLQAQKMEAVGRLAGGIAHDFNNLLAVVVGYASMIMESDTAGPAVRTYASEIADASARGAELTGRLMAFSRPRPTMLTDVDLGDVVADIARLAERLLPDGVRLVADTGDGEAVVHADGTLLEHAVMNLIVNAADAMPKGGQITLRVEMHGERARVTVADTGAGIAPSDRTRVFEPFYTTKEHGSGLGLATAHAIVEQAGGTITFESTVGVGTEFTIELPRASGRHTAARPTPTLSPVTGNGQGETVLVVEDDSPVRELMRRALEAAGYRVVAAADGLAAERVVASAGPPALVVADVEMPGLTGTELVRRLRARHPDVRALLVSGYVGPESIGDVNGEGYLAKPFTPAELAERVRAALDE